MRMVMKPWMLVLVAALALSVTACSHKKSKDEDEKSFSCRVWGVFCGDEEDEENGGSIYGTRKSVDDVDHGGHSGDDGD